MAKKQAAGGGRRGRKPTGVTPTITLTARVRPALGRAFVEYIQSQRPPLSMTGSIETAIEDWLAARGVVVPDES
jgi:hypothetical protein